MAAPKQFITYAQQRQLLEQCSMVLEDPVRTEALLHQLNFYCLSGYWHPMRQYDAVTRQNYDMFRPGASFELMYELYVFDEQLRHIVLGELARIDLAIRALLGHELGTIDPFVHLNADLLGATAQQVVSKSDKTRYEIWLEKYSSALRDSREDFVSHHKKKHGGKLPIWAAVEVMDWGMLSHFFGMAPGRARNRVAEKCGLRAPQLESWLKSLNILRNYSAHHARLFNRVFDIKPKLSSDPRLAVLKGNENRVFAQLTLIQYLHRELGLSAATELPMLLTRYPENEIVQFTRMGVSASWQQAEFWLIHEE